MNEKAVSKRIAWFMKKKHEVLTASEQYKLPEYIRKIVSFVIVTDKIREFDIKRN